MQFIYFSKWPFQTNEWPIFFIAQTHAFEKKNLISLKMVTLNIKRCFNHVAKKSWFCRAQSDCENTIEYRCLSIGRVKAKARPCRISIQNKNTQYNFPIIDFFIFNNDMPSNKQTKKKKRAASLAPWFAWHHNVHIITINGFIIERRCRESVI